MNAPVAPDSDGAGEPRPLIGAIDIDAAAFGAPPVGRTERIVATVAYFGILPVLVRLSKPERRFVRKHLEVGTALYAIRLCWLFLALAGWWWHSGQAVDGSSLRGLLIDAATTIILGAPASGLGNSSALPWLIAPMVVTALLSVLGTGLALTGRSADFHAFTTADWSDPASRRRYLGISPEEEKELARRARERQIERLQQSSRMLRTEHARRTHIFDVESRLERLAMQREYHDQLLAHGEISQRRYEQVNLKVDNQESELRGQLSSLETRVRKAESLTADSAERNRLRRPSETLLESLAIVTPDGIPIFSYGQFQLDDAIVAGMLSAFDSLSEEVFGSRVHKTSLAEGQVLYFAHGDYVLVTAGFADEPSPRQIEDLKTMLRRFESANEGPISREQYDPRYLHEVPIPFRFGVRLQRGPRASQEVV